LLWAIIAAKLSTLPQPRGKKDADFYLRYKKLEILSDAVHLAIPWGSAGVIAYFIYASVGKLAGQTTLAQIGMSFMGNLHVSTAVAYIFGGSGVAYGYRQRALRHKKIADLTAHTQSLEMLVDSKRTSSKLTPQGTTRPEDQI
jgi:hypothetical protein